MRLFNFAISHMNSSEIWSELFSVRYLWKLPLKLVTDPETATPWDQIFTYLQFTGILELHEIDVLDEIWRRVINSLILVFFYFEISQKTISDTSRNQLFSSNLDDSYELISSKYFLSISVTISFLKSWMLYFQLENRKNNP